MNGMNEEVTSVCFDCCSMCRNKLVCVKVEQEGVEIVAGSESCGG